ncbi:MAG: hypothetical protein A3H98_14065 [Bacteroidetes bacterium RIFCSPLOWO2_02_FULL_36_8]|nr:MAG: hypothetical protein A3H98_14065 [Bacteroidetes bacterium RIFCSPLOWO2_02_FULL_36_8]
MNKIRIELKRFLIAGFSAVGTDLSVYYLLLNFLDNSPAKTVSFISGTVVAYILNKYWTFEQKRKSYSEMTRFALLYTITLGANISVNKMSLFIFPDLIFPSFLAATGTSTVLNFIGQKWWVFR